MNLNRMEWPGDLADVVENHTPRGSVDRPIITHQPSFGFQIGWNEPGKWWKPYLEVNVWKVQLQIGWLFD